MGYYANEPSRSKPFAGALNPLVSVASFLLLGGTDPRARLCKPIKLSKPGQYFSWPSPAIDFMELPAVFD